MGKWRITKASDGAWEAWNPSGVLWFVEDSWHALVRKHWFERGGNR